LRLAIARSVNARLVAVGVMVIAGRDRVSTRVPSVEQRRMGTRSPRGAVACRRLPGVDRLPVSSTLALASVELKTMLARMSVRPPGSVRLARFVTVATGGVNAFPGITTAPTLFDAADAAVCQLLRFARAVNVYAVPTVRPVTVQDVAGLVTTHCFEASWVAVMV